MNGLTMLNEPDLENLEDELRDYRVSEITTHDKLQRLLQKHESLLKGYRQLKSDFEEEKESREKYKKLAKAQERNPFVLVLIDGDGYVFKDDLLSAGAHGGVEASQRLNDRIQDSLRRLGLDDCRIMVKIYCNLAGLSKTLARAKVVGFEARSLAPFTASFTRSQDLYDFVDAGDKKEGADYKIRGTHAHLPREGSQQLTIATEMFRLFADNSQCKHVFFAGCHDTGYLSLLTPFRGKSDRITLLKASAYHSEFNSLQLDVEDVSSLFRIISLEDYAVHNPTKKLYIPASSPTATTFTPSYLQKVCPSQPHPPYHH